MQKFHSLFSLTHLLYGVSPVRYLFGAVIALTLWASGCGNDSTGTEEPSLTGTWTDSIEEVGGNRFDFLLALTQSGSSVSGDYTLTIGLPLGGGSVTGTYTHPDIRLDFPLTVALFGPPISTTCTYTASVNEERTLMRGTLVCSEAVAGEVSFDEVRLEAILTKQ